MHVLLTAQSIFYATHLISLSSLVGHLYDSNNVQPLTNKVFFAISLHYSYVGAQIPVFSHFHGALNGHPLSVGHSFSFLAQTPTLHLKGFNNGQVPAIGHNYFKLLQDPSGHLY